MHHSSTSTRYSLDERRVYRSTALARLPWLDHGFGTRHCGDWTAPSPLRVTLRQIHSDQVVFVRDGNGVLGEGDALVTDRPDIWLAIRTADCVPILLADPRRRVVAAVHAGWRGTAARVVERTLERMRDECGSSPADVCAAIGPAVGGCCYEVGANVAARFTPWIPALEASALLDLSLVNRRQLRLAGLPDSQIETAGMCTRCLPADFHSFRRDGAKAGRMVSAIRVLSP